MLLFTCIYAVAQNVYVLPIKEEIAPPVEKIIEQGFAEAEQKNADYILIEMDTYGGMVDVADRIRTKILDSKIPVWVLIENNAASAGAFISIACDSIFMKPGATIGAATVVNQTGEKVDEKYQSFMRGRMRSTAEETGRNPSIAEAMVDGDVYVPGVNDSGKVVTLTVSEALRVGYCNGQFETIDDLVKAKLGTNVTIIKYQESTITSIVRFFLKPAISGVLVSLIFLGIIFELKSPGIGFPTVVAITAAVLYFVPLYLEGLAANWEIILFGVGIVLLLAEIFVIPGFGVAGVLGICLIFISLVLAMVGTDVQPGDWVALPSAMQVVKGLVTVIVAMIAAAGLTVLVGGSFTKLPLFRRLAVDLVEEKSSGYVAQQRPSESLLGKRGVTQSVLKPSGWIEVEGETYEARAEFGWIEVSQEVEIIRVENFDVIVKVIS